MATSKQPQSKSIGSAWDSRRREVLWRRGGVGLALSGLALSLCTIVTLPAVAAPVGFEKPKVQATKPVKVTDHKPVETRAFTKKQQADLDRAKAVAARTKVTWPEAKTAKLVVAEGSDDGAAVADMGSVYVAGGPAWEGLEAEVADHAATAKTGVTGVAVHLKPTKTQRESAADIAASKKKSGARETVMVSLDYASIAASHGSDWAGRLAPRLYPGCVLSTPEKQECQESTELEAERDTKAQSLTAKVPQTALADSAVGAESVVLFAATGSSATGSGDFTATPLAASSSWSVGGSSGGFSWSYPFTLTDPAAGSSPSLSIEYSSQTVDGMTSTTNNQASLLGEGFDLSQAYIERSYLLCDADGRDGKGDLCWKNDNATLAMAGAGGELVKADDGNWRLANDDGTRVRRIGTAADSTNTRVEANATLAAANPDNNNEYWEVTRPDGTRLYFGRSLVPGQTEPTNSVWTAPVYGNNDGEPCYAAENGAESFCGKQAWRWNLDYVVDTSGNGTAYRYAEELNHYRRNNTTPTEYTRGGRLVEVAYGLRGGADGGTGNDNPPYKVALNYAVRCLASTGCEDYTKATWPDTPFDQLCAEGAECTGQLSPTFFTRNRLNKVTSQTRVSGAYVPVDVWDFDYSWVNPDSQQDSVLWLNSITRTGKVGGDIALPPVKFTWSNHDNRVNTDADGIAPLTRYRLQTITAETGAVTEVWYSDPDCSPGNLPATAESSTRRCYPVTWTPEGATTERNDWFHKYVVTKVSQIDTTAGGDAITTFYDYEGGAAWAYNNSKLVPEKYRTWSQWRGYKTVRTTTGVGGFTDVQTQSVATYFRGMDGDRANAEGGAKDVAVTDSAGDSYADNVHLAGAALESKILTGPGGSVHIGSISKPWVHVTAGSGLKSAAFTGTDATVTRQASSAGGFRTRQVDYTHDSATGLVTRVSDHGDTAVENDQTCTANAYVGTQTVDSAWMIGFRSRQVTSKGNCSTDALDPSEANTISHTRTRYDGGTQGQAPTSGLPTETDRIKSFNTAGEPVFQATSTSTFDAYGREVKVVTPAGNGAMTTDTTAYTHTSDGTLASVAETQDSTGKAFKTTTSYTAERSIAWKITDPNLKNTSAAYDALGRAVSVWKTNRSTSATPSVKYAYKVSQTEPLAVTTSTLNMLGNAYRTSVAIYDSLYRPRQTQVVSPGGRLISGALYDRIGNADRTYDRLFTTGAPSDTMAAVGVGGASHEVHTTFDNLARPTKVTEFQKTDELWSTTLTYAGADKATVNPPQGAPSTTGYTNIRGQQIKQIEHGSTAARDLITTYDYDLAGRMVGMDSPAGDFTWAYDLRGRKISQTDPEAGTTSVTYTENDLPATTTDARGKSTSTVYDQLNRPTALYDGTAVDSSKLLTAWTYDTTLKGLPASTSRYVGGSTGAKFTHAISNYNSAYNVDLEKVTITGAAAGAEAITSLDNGLPASLTHEVAYNTGDQSVAIDSVPSVAVGGTILLAGEDIDYTYDELGNPLSMLGASWIVQGIEYDGWNQPSIINLGQGPDKSLYLSNTYQEGTGRLTRTLATTSLSETVVSDHHYTFDAAGNPLKDDDSANGDAQCFTYDDHRRLSAAWTPADANCDSSAATALLGGPSPYRQTWTYTDTGLRKTQASHLPAAGPASPASDVTDTYAYPGSGSSHANFPNEVKRTNTATGEVIETDAYGVDAAGNTTSRPGVAEGTAQDLTWNSEGDLSSLTVKGDGADKATTYVYGADGTLLVKDSPTEKTLMYFGLEITVDKSATPWVTSASRHYNTLVGEVAVRHSDGTMNFQIPDANGTAQTSLDGATLTATRRYMTPFGEDRASITGTAASEDSETWPTSRGFLNMQADTDTGLTSVGARQYDPTIGRFLSVDPLLTPTDPGQALGYSYANNNPVTFSDPTGLHYDNQGPGGGGGGGGGGSDSGVDGWCDPGVPGCSSDSAEDDVNYQVLDGTSTGGSTGGGTGGSTGGGSAPLEVGGSSQAEEERKRKERERIRREKEKLAEAQATLDRSLGDMLLKLGADALLDFMGYNDLVDCLNADPLACVSLVLSSVPIGKAYKAGKAAAKLGKAAAELLADQKAARKLIEQYNKLRKKACQLPGNSFTATTLVLLADGSRKPIKDVRLGDLVMATNPITGESGPRKVVDLIRHYGPHVMVAVLLADGTTIDATDEHPFWVTNRGGQGAGDGSWVDAIDLRFGDRVITNEDRQVLVVSSGVAARDLMAYNLTVEGLHTFYISEIDVLVHNDYVPAPKELPGFPDARSAKRKTPVQGGGGLRKRWTWDGKILEWDSQHGEVEMYDKRGKHLGAYDPQTGARVKGPEAGRRCAR